MKFSAPAKRFAAALAPVARVAPSKSSIPILSHALIEVSGGRATFVAGDLDREAEAFLDVPGASAVDGAACLPAGILLDILKKLPADGEVTVECADERATVRAGRPRFSLPALPAADFPRLSGGAFPATFALEAATLAALLAETAFAISTEETRYYLNGIYWHFCDDDLRFVATDGHRLARTGIPRPKGAEAAPNVIVPTSAVKEFARRAGEAKDGEAATISLSPERLRLSIGGHALTTKLVDGSFPDYGRIIPTGAATKATLDREGLRAGIELVLPVAESKGHATKFEFDADQVAISVNNPDSGAGSTAVDAALEGALTIGFNAKYVLEALAAFSAERVSLAMTDAGSPALLTAEGARDGSRRLTVVIMPLRV